jgi:Icc-related predicted phosphoesterase
MKSFIFSDHQCDFWDRITDFCDHIDADIAIVAGDHSPNLVSSVVALSDLAEKMPVIYVPGNRDYYGTSFDKANELALKAAEKNGVRLLINDTYDINGVRFIGSTLWTDFQLDGSERAEELVQANFLADNVMIANWSPSRQLEEHKKARSFIGSKLAEPFSGTKIVVTHHTPHRNSVHSRYDGSPHNACFTTDLSSLLDGFSAPDLWVHGAVHSNHDYVVGNSRVICNSRGYFGENSEYVESLVLDLRNLRPSTIIN